jgi:hypothetical protein
MTQIMFGVMVFSTHMHGLQRASIGRAVNRAHRRWRGAELGLFSLFMTLLYLLAKY